MVKADERMTLVEHLVELRKRLFVAVLGLVAAIIVAAVFNSRIFDLLLRPLPAKLRFITTFSPAEPFMVSVKVWVYAGIILASPLLFYEFWAFVGPAFTSGEKKHIMPVVAICSLLFIGGVVFGYLIVLPRGLQFLLGWNAGFFNIQNRAQDYLTFVAWFLVAFGAVFEMPVIIVAAVRMGIVDVRFLTKNRKYAILINAAVAAVVTPSQDAFSMLAMFAPLVVFYEVAIVVARVMQKRRAKALAAAGNLPGEPPHDKTSPTPA